MKNSILVSITILAVSFFFIGQTSPKKDFDAEAKYKVLERVLIKLINEKKSTDAKLEKIEAELKDWKKAYLMEIANKEIESGLTKMLDEKFPTKEKKSPPQSLDWNTKQILDKIKRDIKTIEWKLDEFLGTGYTGGSFDISLEEIQDALNNKSDRFHFH